MIVHVMHMFFSINQQEKQQLVKHQEQQPGMVVEIPMKEPEPRKEAEVWDICEPQRWHDIKFIWWIV